MSKEDKPPSEGVHTDFRERMSYGDYLQLDRLLDCQKPLSTQHDETLFIIIHQASELWMRLVIHELKAAIANIRADRLQPAFKMAARVKRVLGQLIQSWDVLSTLTPADYMTFREALGQSSGFQSYQYRMIEFLLGNKQGGMLEPHRHRADIAAALEAALAAPSLYDEAQRLLKRRGFAIAPEHLERDLTQPYRADDSVRRAWLEVYRNSSRHWELYELAEVLLDIEDGFQQWRFRHVTTVERIIGGKPGTGGTAGVAYLRKALDIRFFPELWEVRTEI
jgi:tryptophan 2,3-dioxygenase